MLPITASNPFKWRHYPGDIIMWCVRWYLRYPISFMHMAEMAVERGLAIDCQLHLAMGPGLRSGVG
jgi:transposase-like protein